MLICCIRLLCDWWFHLCHCIVYICYFIASYIILLLSFLLQNFHPNDCWWSCTGVLVPASFLMPLVLYSVFSLSQQCCNLVGPDSSSNFQVFQASLQAFSGHSKRATGITAIFIVHGFYLYQILTVYSHFWYQVFQFFCIFVKNLMPSMHMRGFIFSCYFVNLLLLVQFLSMQLSGIIAIANSIGKAYLPGRFEFLPLLTFFLQLLILWQCRIFLFPFIHLCETIS